MSFERHSRRYGQMLIRKPGSISMMIPLSGQHQSVGAASWWLVLKRTFPAGMTGPVVVSFRLHKNCPIQAAVKFVGKGWSSAS